MDRPDNAQTMPQRQADPARSLGVESPLQPAVDHVVDLVDGVAPGGVVRKGASNHRAQFLLVASVATTK